MNTRLITLSLLIGAFVSIGRADESDKSPFSFSFLPGASESFVDSSTDQDPNQSSRQSIGGFNFGLRSPEGSGDTAWHSHLNVTEFQSLISAGISSVLFETDSYIVSGQALGGFAYGHRGFSDSWHGSFDLYGATELGKSGSTLMKLGVFADLEENFGKWGPEAAFLFGADKEHPMTIDVAYGRGIGELVRFNNAIWSVAQDDLQLRAGVFLNNSLQVGVSGHYQKWDDLAGVEKDWKTGGFINWFPESGMVVSLGMANGEHGSNGFASFSFTPGNNASNPLPSAKGGKEIIVPEPQFARRSWMTAPVRRLYTVGVRKVSNNPSMLGGSLVGTFFANGDPNQAIGTALDQYRATYTNTTSLPQTVTIVSLERFNGLTENVSVTATLNAGSTLSAVSSPSFPVGAGPFIQTVVISVNGQTFNADLSFPAGITNGTSIAPVSVP